MAGGRCAASELLLAGCRKQSAAGRVLASRAR